jgi:predicted aspartyl protease
MMLGTFREDHPRITLPLPQIRAEIDVEFIIDTGFVGDLALPAHLAGLLEGTFAGFGERRLANGQYLKCRTCEIMLDWNDELRPTEVLILEGDPLLGTVILRENLLQIEMMDGGEVSIEAL